MRRNQGYSIQYSLVADIEISEDIVVDMRGKSIVDTKVLLACDIDAGDGMLRYYTSFVDWVYQTKNDEKSQFIYIGNPGLNSLKLEKDKVGYVGLGNIGSG